MIWGFTRNDGALSSVQCVVLRSFILFNFCRTQCALYHRHSVITGQWTIPDDTHGQSIDQAALGACKRVPWDLPVRIQPMQTASRHPFCPQLEVPSNLMVTSLDGLLYHWWHLQKQFTSEKVKYLGKYLIIQNYLWHFKFMNLNTDWNIINCWLIRGSLFIELGCQGDLRKGWRGHLGTFMISRPV